MWKFVGICDILYKEIFKTVYVKNFRFGIGVKMVQ